MKEIAELKKLWGTIKYEKVNAEFNGKLLSFESKIGLTMPPDLIEYFRLLDKVDNKLDENLYQFYGLDEFKSIKQELMHWEGVPNYKNIANTLDGFEKCFVFADYMFHMFTYTIRLHKSSNDINEIYIICGDKYKIIANSFSDFLNLYFENSIELQFT